jgi:hypothetical protein
MIRRRTVEVEFGRAELPVDDDRIKLRMLASLDVRPGDKVLTTRITQREHTRRGTFLYRGAVSIEVADGNEPKFRPVTGQPGGPQTADTKRQGWWQRTSPR